MVFPATGLLFLGIVSYRFLLVVREHRIGLGFFNCECVEGHIYVLAVASPSRSTAAAPRLANKRTIESLAMRPFITGIPSTFQRTK